jgi:hypothetical protein
VIVPVDSVLRTGWTDKGLAFIEAFNGFSFLKTLERMRGLNLFSEDRLGPHLGITLDNRLYAALRPPEPAFAEPKKSKRAAGVAA